MMRLTLTIVLALALLLNGLPLPKVTAQNKVTLEPPFVYVDNSIADGAAEGKFTDTTAWPQVVVRIHNPHRFWTKITVFEDNDNKITPANVWARIGYMPKDADADYSIDFDSEFDTSVRFFINAAKTQDGSLSASAITAFFRLIDTIIIAVSGLNLDPNTVDPEVWPLVFEQMAKAPDCVKAAQKLSEASVIGVPGNIQLCMSSKAQQQAILYIAQTLAQSSTNAVIKAAAKNITKDLLKKVFRVSALIKLSWDLVDTVKALITGSYAGSVGFNSVAQLSITFLPEGSSPIQVKERLGPGIDRMKFVKDVTLLDNTVIAPGQSLSKTWRLQNTGTTTWDNRYSIVFLEGTNFGALAVIALPGVVVLPGETVELTVPVDIPKNAGQGTYLSRWQLRNAAGKPFGTKFWYQIVVKSEESSSVAQPPPAPQPPAASPPKEPQAPVVVEQPSEVQLDFRVDRTEISAGECTTLYWDVDNVKGVYLDNHGVAGHDSLQVCPTASQTFHLVIVRQDQSKEEHTITIQVNASSSAEPSISFSVDRTALNGGECAILRWEVDNVNEIHLDDEGVVGHDTRKVCPKSTKTYKLKVVRRDNNQEERTVTIQVNSVAEQVGSVVEVYANQDWQDTGVLVQPSDTLTIQYISGFWSPWPSEPVTGNGVPRDCDVQTTETGPVPGVCHASLIGRIGNGAPFYIGNGTTLSAEVTGDIFLRINDSQLGDNSGSIKVQVTATH